MNVPVVKSTAVRLRDTMSRSDCGMHIISTISDIAVPAMRRQKMKCTERTARHHLTTIAMGTGIAGSSQPSRTVLQADLQLIRELGRAMRRYSALRQGVLEILDAGGDVEPGPLGVSVTAQEMRVISYPKLVDAIGQQDADWIGSHVEPTIIRRLIIVDERRHGRGAGEGKLA